MSGFGSFGADPFAVDDDEEEEAEAPADVDEDGHHDYSYSSHQETIMEEEETGDTAEDATEQAQDVYDKSLEDADGSANATLGSLSTAGDKENSWQVTEASSGASFQAESGQRTKVEDNLEESTVIIEEEETTIVKRRRKINKDGTVTEEESVETLPSTGYSVTETYEHEEEDMKTKGRITTIGGEKEYSTTEEDGSVS